jgi:hypothetical protein
VFSAQRYVRHGDIHIWLDSTMEMAQLTIRSFRILQVILLYILLWYNDFICIHLIYKATCDFFIVKAWHLTHYFRIESSSVNEAHHHSIMPTSGNCIRTSWKLITTDNNNIWKYRILKQIIEFQLYLMI